MPIQKPHILLIGQTPPPWHGQAVATQILFDYDWPDYEVHRLRMEFSEDMLEVGRFQWKKIRHLFHLIRTSRSILEKYKGCVLFYPPASAKWIPFLRDVVFLVCVRRLAGSTVFIFHASGLPVFTKQGMVRAFFSRLAYSRADVSLEVAQELLPPHRAFYAKRWHWCPCAIQVPEKARATHRLAGPVIVLFVGSLQEGKGVIEVIKTAAILKSQGRELDFRFRLVGNWFSKEFERSVIQLRQDLELVEMVELSGQLTGDAKWDAYAKADIFFFPTHYASEATPLVLMEALGMGLPIITTNWAGISAMLAGCTSAKLLPIKSPEAYAAALACQELKTETIGQVSKDFYLKHFLPIRFIQRVGNAFEEALESQTSTTNNASTLDGKYFSDSIETHKLLTNITAYLADQNPGHDRSYGISRMSHVVLESLHNIQSLHIRAIISKSSQKAPGKIDSEYILPWGTRKKWLRLLTDHLHPLITWGMPHPDLYYFPKGYLPLLSICCRPSVVTIHDTIIQYDADHYPNWRKRTEYAYWEMMLKHTLREANRILTVSETSKRQIYEFMDRHRLPQKEITVTYEPCLYQKYPQPVAPVKENYVIHLASCEPHKRTAHLIRWWHEAETQGRNLPTLQLIGTVPPEVESLLASSLSIVKRPFLEEVALQSAYLGARALVLPSEIEGFGLPALEAYYLGTPICFVKGTSVEEILGVATAKGGFSLNDPESLFAALDEVTAMSPLEIHSCGLKLRETYAAEKVAERMAVVFREVAGKN